jgi:RNA polymerase sigma factor (sigma-70 family)
LNFRPLPEYELARLNDDQLVAYIAAARDAGDGDSANLGLGILAYRRYPDVVRRVQAKVPGADVEDVAMEALSSAVKSAFDGTSVGEFVKWLQRITSRRIADYHRAKRDPTVPLAEERDDDDSWGEDLIDDDFSDEVDTRGVIEQALGELGQVHAAVVEHYVAGLSAKETADQVNISMQDELTQPMTDTNVHQIAKRFRVRLKELLEDARGPG